MSLVLPASAQEEVWVTTKDNASLRGWPGTSFDKLATVPFSTTLQASGRNEDSSWVQVNYNGTGNLEALLIDGIQAAPPPVPPASD